MKLGEKVYENMEVIKTGSLSLDMALGVGGYPKGRIIEIYGPESSGKTTFALHAIAEAQKKGGYAAFIDAEHALDPKYAKALGVDVDNLILSQPDTGEQALEITEQLVRSNAIDIVVIDSVAALVPKVEIDGDMGDSHVGLQARLMSQAMRKLSGVISKTNTVAIFINQIREKVGVMFGSPETTSGGRALKFYSTIRLDIRRVEGIKQGDNIIGNLTRIKVVKNKVAAPFKTVEVDLIYGQGVSRYGEILDLAVENDIVDKSGAWFSYEGEKIGQGRENVKKYLKENPNLCQDIEEKIKKKYEI
jgi:recombination protein RecA